MHAYIFVSLAVMLSSCFSGCYPLTALAIKHQHTAVPQFTVFLFLDSWTSGDNHFFCPTVSFHLGLPLEEASESAQGHDDQTVEKLLLAVAGEKKKSEAAGKHESRWLATGTPPNAFCATAPRLRDALGRETETKGASGGTPLCAARLPPQAAEQTIEELMEQVSELETRLQEVEEAPQPR